MQSPEEGPSSAGANPGYEERTSDRCTEASQRPVQDQLEDELTQERGQITSPTPPAEVVVPEPELAPNRAELPRRKKWTSTMKLDLLREYYQVTENEANRSYPEF